MSCFFCILRLVQYCHKIFDPKSVVIICKTNLELMIGFIFGIFYDIYCHFIDSSNFYKLIALKSFFQILIFPSIDINGGKCIILLFDFSKTLFYV
jgi:hypothetical protein